MTTAPSPDPSPTVAAPAPPLASDRGAVRSASTAVALGVALLAAAIVQSAVYARSDGDLDWKYYGVGLGAAIVLLLIAPLAVVFVSDAAMRTAVGSWPAAFGALGLGLMVAIGMEDNDAVPWVVGGLILGLSVVGWVLARGGAPTVTAVLGLGVLYARAFDEVVGVDESDTGVATVGAGLLVFVVGVTVLGWLLPATRALTGVVVGVIGLIGFIAIMAVIGLSGFFGAFVPFALDPSAPLSSGATDVDQDTYITLAYTAGLVLVWALASLLSHHPGFRVLIVTLTAAILPLAVFNLGVDDPNWVALGAALLGAVVVLLVLASGRGGGGGHRGTRKASDAPAPPAAAAPEAPTTTDDAATPPADSAPDAAAPASAATTTTAVTPGAPTSTPDPTPPVTDARSTPGTSTPEPSEPPEKKS
ncbi:MAG: hypothetical protein WB767_04280 [Nocardioides sp.]